MATISTLMDLVIGTRVDPTGVTAGLNRVAQEIEKSTGRWSAAVAGSIIDADAIRKRAGAAVRDVGDTMVAALGARSTALGQQFAKGLIDRTTLDIEGTKAAQQFADGVRARLQGLQAKGLLPESFGAPLIAAMRKLGEDMGDDLHDAFADRVDRIKDVGETMQAAGRGLTAAITAPLTAMAAAGLAAQHVMEGAAQRIRQMTGATGAAFDTITASVTNLLQRVPETGEKIATALAMVYQETRLLGPSLEALALKFLGLAYVQGAPLQNVIRSTVAAFHNWNISTNELDASLDFLLKLSQRTGTAVTDIAQQVTAFGPSFRAMGFNFEQAAALLANFAQVGVDAGDVLAKLQPTLYRLQQRGLSGSQGFIVLTKSIKDATSTTEAMSIAQAAFGVSNVRAAQGLAAFVDAVRSGRLDVDNLLTSVRASNETVKAAAISIQTWGMALQVLKNQLVVALAPLGESLTRTLKTLGPTLSAMVNGIRRVFDAFNNLPRPIQQFLIGMAAIAASFGPILLVAGTITKAFGSMASHLVSLGHVAQAAAGGMTAFKIAMADAGAKGKGLIGILGALVSKLGVGGFIAAALGAIAAGVGIALVARKWDEVHKGVNAAKQATTDFSDSLAGLDEIHLAIRKGDLDQMRNDLLAAKNAIETNLNPQTPAQLAAVQAQQAAAGGAAQWWELEQRNLTRTNELLVENARRYSILTAAEQDVARQKAEDTEATRRFNIEVQKTIDRFGGGKLRFRFNVDKATAQREIDYFNAAILKLRVALASHSNKLGIDDRVAKSAMEWMNEYVGLLQTRIQGIDLKSLFPDVVTTDVQQLAGHVSRLVAAFQALHNPIADLMDPALAAKARTAWDQVTAALRQQGDQLNANSITLRQAADALKEFAIIGITHAEIVPDVKPITLNATARVIAINPPPNVPEMMVKLTPDFATLRSLAQSLQTATTQVDLAKALGMSLDEVNAREAKRLALVMQIGQVERDIGAAMSQWNVAGSTQTAIWQRAEATVGQFGMSLSGINKELQQQVEDLAAAGAKLVGQIGVIHPVIKPSFDISAAKQLAADFAEAQRVAEATASLAPNTATAADAAVHLTSVTRQMAQFAEDYANEVRAASDNSMTAGEATAQLLDYWKGLRIDVNAVAAAMQRATFAGKMREAATAADAVSNALGNWGSELAGAIRGVAAMADAWDQLDAAIASTAALDFSSIFSGVAGMASGIAGVVSLLGPLLGGLFGGGPSPEDKAIQDNTQALYRLTRSLDAQAKTGTEYQRYYAAVSEIFRTPNTFVNPPNFAPGVNANDYGLRAIQAILAKYNITWQEFQRYAKDEFGLTIVADNMTHLSQSMMAFDDAIGQTMIAMAQWDQSLAGQKSLLDYSKRAAGTLTPGTETPAESIKGWLDTLNKVAPQLFATYFKGIDYTTSAGQAQLRKALQRLIDAIGKGKIIGDLLGGMKNVGELDPMLSALLDALDEMAGAVNGVTDTLLNVPEGWKVALAAFNAQLPKSSTPAVTVPTTVTPPIPTLPVTPVTFDMAAMPALSATMSDALGDTMDPVVSALERLIGDQPAGTVEFSGPIYIEAGDKSPADILDGLIAEARRRSLARFGTTVRASDVLNA